LFFPYNDVLMGYWSLNFPVFFFFFFFGERGEGTEELSHEEAAQEILKDFAHFLTWCYQRAEDV
jgi:hypothetical protein